MPPVQLQFQTQSHVSCPTGKVPETIAHFVPFGATVNTDGGAVYFVCACIWLAQSTVKK